MDCIDNKKKSPQWVGFNEGDLEISRPNKVWEDIECWIVFIIGNSINLQIINFGSKN